MIPFKLDENTLYTDIDSIFTLIFLPYYLISSKELDFMIDELNGNVIKEAYFLGIKLYGYYYEENDKIIEKSTFVGVPKNQINFKEIIENHKGNTINKTVPLRKYKKFKVLNVSINIYIKLLLKRTNDKKLLENKYIPIEIKLIEDDSFFTKTKIRVLKILKHFK